MLFTKLEEQTKHLINFLKENGDEHGVSEYNKFLTYLRNSEKEILKGLIQVGNKVVVILPEKPLEERRYSELIGYEAICVGYNESPNYFYELWFTEEKGRELHEKNHHVFFHPSYLKDLGKDELGYQAYLNNQKGNKNIYNKS